MPGIVWSRSAREQLRAIRSRRVRGRLRRRVALLQRFPESGRVIPEIGREDVREIVVGVFRVAYLVRRDDVVIQSVWDARRGFIGDRIGEPAIEYEAASL